MYEKKRKVTVFGFEIRLFFFKNGEKRFEQKKKAIKWTGTELDAIVF